MDTLRVGSRYLPGFSTDLGFKIFIIKALSLNVVNL